jgi:hypothetical protein
MTSLGNGSDGNVKCGRLGRLGNDGNAGSDGKGGIGSGITSFGSGSDGNVKCGRLGRLGNDGNAGSDGKGGIGIGMTSFGKGNDGILQRLITSPSRIEKQRGSSEPKAPWEPEWADLKFRAPAPDERGNHTSRQT